MFSSVSTSLVMACCAQNCLNAIFIETAAKIESALWGALTLGQKYYVMNETPREVPQSMRALTVVTYKPDANDNISKPCRPAEGQMCWFRLLEKTSPF